MTRGPRVRRLPGAYFGIALCLGLAACAAPTAPETKPASPYAPVIKDKDGDGLIALAIIMPDESSDARVAGTASLVNAFAAAGGYPLNYWTTHGDVAEQQQVARDLTDGGFELLILDPIPDQGWTAVLQRVRDRGVPVILVGEKPTVPADLYMTWFESRAQACVPLWGSQAVTLVTRAAAGQPVPKEVRAAEGLADDDGTPTPPESACAGDTASPSVRDRNGDGLLTVGLLMPGAEASWRTANYASLTDYFVPANGYELIVKDASSDDAKQRADVRDVIAEGAEVIVLEAVTDRGWGPVLLDAKNAGVPVILADRALPVPDDLYLAWFGLDVRGEGDAAVAWLAREVAASGLSPVAIAHLQGTIGSTAQIGRSKALAEGVAANGWDVVCEESGEFTQMRAEQVMASCLASGAGVTVIYAESDEMAYGTIDALKAAGKDPRDYVIISFGGQKPAVQSVLDGEIDLIVETTPDWGPQIGALIQASAAGEVPKIVYATEGLIDASTAAQAIATAWPA